MHVVDTIIIKSEVYHKGAGSLKDKKMNCGEGVLCKISLSLRRRGHRQKDYERGREVGSVKKLRTIRKIKGIA